ncbi:MAG TPA: hypothetical protein ENJ60_08295 [Aeromonadales bacterium]|nr:hypothetical protein [Aeromonadales bacterium]
MYKFDRIVFLEIIEFFEECASEIVVQVLQNEQVINCMVKQKGQLIAVSGFIQIQKQVREEMDQQSLNEIVLQQVAGF